MTRRTKTGQDAPLQLRGPLDLAVEADEAAVPPAKGRRKGERQLAIALHHERSGDKAPVVVAKGYGELAEKILQVAFANDVKVRQDPDLAQVLSVVEVDCEIPLEAFAAVAEILTYVYRANGEMPLPRDGE